MPDPSSPGNSKPGIGFRDIVRGLREVGLDRTARVLAHASLSSLGNVHGGAETVVGALTATCKLVAMPAFTYQTLVLPETGPPNNGVTYGTQVEQNEFAEFWHPNLTVHDSLGEVADALLRVPEVARGNHPALSFAAVGEEARAMVATQTLDDPFGPIRWLAEREGDVLLIGVTHKANTAIHYGEQRAGRRQFVRWALTAEKIVQLPRWPGDSSGFDAIAPQLDGTTVRGQIGMASVQRIPVQLVLKATEDMIRADPNALLCQNPSCERCSDIRKTVATAASR